MGYIGSYGLKVLGFSVLGYGGFGKKGSFWGSLYFLFCIGVRLFMETSYKPGESSRSKIWCRFRLLGF